MSRSRVLALERSRLFQKQTQYIDCQIQVSYFQLLAGISLDTFHSSCALSASIQSSAPVDYHLKNLGTPILAPPL